jgi:hypothetical protein
METHHFPHQFALSKVEEHKGIYEYKKKKSQKKKVAKKRKDHRAQVRQRRLPHQQ